MIICGKSNLNTVSSLLCLYKNVFRTKQVKVSALEKFSCNFFFNAVFITLQNSM